MNRSAEAVVEPQSASLVTPAARDVCIDLDRFCEGCGYNLRTLPVYRDPGTAIPVVRCPECGRFQPANHAATALHPWLNRATSVLLVAWMAALVGVFVLLAMGEGAIGFATLDELTAREGSTFQRIGNITYRTSGSSAASLAVLTNYPDYKRFLASIFTFSFILAFACGVFAVVAFPHWRRGAYTAIVLTTPVVAGAFAAFVWNLEAPHLFDWGLRFLGSHVGVQLFGGLLGVWIGRPLARLTIRILLPPGVRPRLAYLWLTDNKPLPRPARTHLDTTATDV